MKTNKYQQVKSIADQSSIADTRIDSALQTLVDTPISLAFPLIKTQSGDSQILMQITLALLDKSDNLIQHESVLEFNQYLSNNLKVKQVNIRTIQISKNKKMHSGKSDTVITSGKNVGKKSETTILQQAIQEAQKKYLKFVAQKNDAYPHFMLLDLYKYQKQTNGPVNTSKQLQFPQYVQRKYDGLRCGAFSRVVQGQKSEVVLLSRGHKEFTALTRLSTEFQQLFAYIDQSPEFLQLLREVSNVDQSLTSANLMIDGELYIHGKSLQTLNSVIRNASADQGTLQKNEVQFLAYDVDITVNDRTQQITLSFQQRLRILNHISVILADRQSQINIAPTITVQSESELNSLFALFIEQNYEGAVIRAPTSLYCYSVNNRRSPDSIKYKLKLDMEVAVLDFLAGQGKDATAIIFQCSLLPPNNTSHSFQVVQNTTYEKRKALFALLNTKPQYLEILKKIPLNIEYATLSSTGVPQQPRGIYFRTEHINLDVPTDLMELLE